MTKKLCLFYGNCQVITYLFEKINQISEFTNIYECVAYVNHDRDNISELKTISMEHLKNCDVFIYQPLTENHGVYSTNYVRQFLKPECNQISFPYIYNSAIYTCYWEPASTRWSIGTLVNCGWRHIMELIFQGHTIETVLHLYDNNGLDFYFSQRMNTCIEYLRRRESECNIKVSDFILNNYKDKRLFITQNHLTSHFFNWIANRVFEKLQINFRFSENYQHDSTIEAACIHDKYSQNFHNFSFPLDILSDDPTKSKIVNFFQFFTSVKEQYNYNDLQPYIIDKDPEKFNNPLGF